MAEPGVGQAVEGTVVERAGTGGRVFIARTTEAARDALRRFCEATWHPEPEVLARRMDQPGGRMVFTIPVNNERDADCILSDVIAERDALTARLDALEREREALAEFLRRLDRYAHPASCTIFDTVCNCGLALLLAPPAPAGGAS